MLDRHRKPVEGLTAADFTLRDNGEVRPIVAFTPVARAKGAGIHNVRIHDLRHAGATILMTPGVS